MMHCRSTHSLSQLLSQLLWICHSCHICLRMSSGNSAALEHLALSDSEREALEGHRTLVLTSSQALPDCALNCSSFFLNDTLFAVATLSLMRSLQFTCVNSALIRSWFRKAQQVPCLLLWFCLAFLFIVTVQMWWAGDELLHCWMLCFSGSGHLLALAAEPGPGRGDLWTTVGREKGRCHELEPHIKLAARQKDRFSDLPFTFRKNHSCHICLE